MSSSESGGTPKSPNPSPSPSGKGAGGGHVFQAPTGTRDFYPAELNRLRYVQDAWRRTSINHGFEEIDGPTFEHLDLYTVKSGEGIVSELFSFERFGGEKTFALRPEFTPTLARMYASKAASLPKPTKWFWMQNCYRAERPQRGRLREFCQWNCDVIGDDSIDTDAELIGCCVGMFEQLGLSSEDVQVRLNHREAVYGWLSELRIAIDKHDAVIALLDKRGRKVTQEFRDKLAKLGLLESQVESLSEAFHDLPIAEALQGAVGEMGGLQTSGGLRLRELCARLQDLGLSRWCRVDTSIFRGLAYYTGMVFEVHEVSGAERAIAGGGRYDRLIEMFGGPPTPAVGFGMGDVVLSLVLADKGKMPTDPEVARRLGLNPDAIVVSNGSAEADGAVAGAVASLRRAGLHARRSSKKIGKAMQDAAKVGARFCVILEGAEKATVKDMGTQGQEMCGVGELVGRVARR